MSAVSKVIPRRQFIGLFLGGLLGVAGTAELLIHHPHLAARLRAALMPPATDSSLPAGELSNVAVSVDSSAAGRPISPFIYGVAFADAATLKALGATVDRWGGNTTTRYNWVIGHAWNSARDWEFRNNDGGHPQGQMAEAFVAGALAGGAVPLITIPSIGFVARNDDNQTKSVGVPAQGGPPLAPGSSAIAGYNPAANRQVTSVPSFATKPGQFTLSPPASSQAVYQDEWVHELQRRFGAAPKGVGYFTIDNEPDLWSTTHTDVHPVRMSYDDMLSNYQQYALAVKAQDPNALLLGPDVSGWTGYFYSDLDRGNDNFTTHADRTAHGGQPFLPWWLGQVAKADRARGARSLDLLDVHFYPQAAGVFSERADTATQALRIRSVRSLYDANYTDESWIATPVELIPRLKQWIAQQYPGTGLAITEYNWGGEKDASGAVALAEVLGIYGREGVELATYWTYPPLDSPAGAAFRLYRNFDGHGARFGDISLPVTTSQTAVVAYAARHSESHELDVVLVNEAADQTATVHLNFGLGETGVATQFQVAPGSSAIAKSPLSDPAGPVALPPYSVTLIQVVQR
ncbi:MAG TPA: glycoside hydrolase family 44 protein [Candidatus Micrarchaeaceae archaeon]|nr:glycoside hydrolase family 44 protein [Candidatus Micrarchaeaceae archaeon]